MKKIAIVFVSFLVLHFSNNIHAKKTQHIALTGPFIEVMDKLMPGSAYGLMLQVRRETRKRLFGVEQKDGSRVGFYDYQDKKCSVGELEAIENQFKKAYWENRAELDAEIAKYSREELDLIDDLVKKIIKIEKKFYYVMHELRKVLKIAKEDFLELSERYVDSARGTKKEILALIKESCEKRGVGECFILRWGEADEGNESDLLRYEVLTFKEYAKFCRDLSNFLADMAGSCPRTKKKFIDMVRKGKKK